MIYIEASTHGFGELGKVFGRIIAHAQMQTKTRLVISRERICPIGQQQLDHFVLLVKRGPVQGRSALLYMLKE